MLRWQLVLSMLIITTITSCSDNNQQDGNNYIIEEPVHIPPDTVLIPDGEFGDMVRYGRDLIENTAYYLGPDGTVGQYLNNKMNCGNCHLDAGTRPYAFNFFSSHGRYPQYRSRENRILTLADRVNNCIERPHHGKPLPLGSKEMVAMVSYMSWLAQGVKIGERVEGDDGLAIKLLNRAADIEKGAAVYEEHCVTCHGKDGEGQWNFDSTTYAYPPLWGPYSYEKGSSLHRVVKAAKFIKANMPDKEAHWHNPVLTDEEATDVAAFINDDRIHDRPEPQQNVKQYENKYTKPVDYGTGPFPDTFSALQHKFGPFQPIVDFYEANGLRVKF